MRLFVGIPLPPTVRDALVTSCREIRSADPRWRGEKWVAADNLHITLAFLGDLPADCVVPLSESIRANLAETHAFELPFARLEPIPGARRASMIWASFEDPGGACAALASAVQRAAALYGVVADERAFKAHVTLARARRPIRASGDALSAMSHAPGMVPPFVSVLSATLFSSTLTKAGPRYERLETWEFPS